MWKCSSDNVLINYSEFILRIRHITKNVLEMATLNENNKFPVAASCRMAVDSMKSEQPDAQNFSFYFLLSQGVMVNQPRWTPMSHWKHHRLTTPAHQIKPTAGWMKMKWLLLKNNIIYIYVYCPTHLLLNLYTKATFYRPFHTPQSLTNQGSQKVAKSFLSENNSLQEAW